MLFMPKRPQSKIFRPLLVSLFILKIFKYFALFSFTSVDSRMVFDLIGKGKNQIHRLCSCSVEQETSPGM